MDNNVIKQLPRSEDRGKKIINKGFSQKIKYDMNIVAPAYKKFWLKPTLFFI
jgi:hypothetical protein